MKFVIRAAFAAAVLFAAGPAFAKSGELSPADLNALKSYTLSMDKIKAMQAAMDDAKKAGKGDMHDVGDNAKTIADMEAKLKAMPGAMAIFARHGLSAHDVVVMPLALMDAGMCAAYPSVAPKFADRVSAAQIAFYKQHQAELKKVGWLNGSE
jgi:hypothetical protein